MNDGYRRWFDTSAGMGPVRGNNLCTLHIAGEAAFGDLGLSFAGDAGDGAAAYLLGWSIDLDTELLPTERHNDLASLRDLLTHFNAKGGFVRAMLWDNPLQAPEKIAEAVRHINSLHHGAAILDRRTPLAGSHHQKVQIVVSGPRSREPGRVTAYCGGMDLFPDRLGRQALHDVHCRVRGDAAADLLKLFLDRWNDHPARGGDLPSALPPQDPATGTDLVQVCHTLPRFGNPVEFAKFIDTFGETLKNIAKLTGTFRPGDMTDNGVTRLYGFYDTANGVQQIGRAVAKAIREAKRFIYLEDQYLVHPWVARELAKKLKHAGRGFRVVILTTHPDAADIQQVWSRRQQFITTLQAIPGHEGRLRVAIGRSFIHSKTWIFDDELVITGSANIDRRGYTHSSETDVVIAGDLDGARKSWFGATTVAQELRCRLFAKHLGGHPRDHADPDRSLARWFGPLDRTNVTTVDHGSKPGRPDEYVEKLRTISRGTGMDSWLAKGLLTLIDLRPGADAWMRDVVEDPDTNVPDPP